MQKAIRILHLIDVSEENYWLNSLIDYTDRKKITFIIVAFNKGVRFLEGWALKRRLPFIDLTHKGFLGGKFKGIYVGISSMGVEREDKARKKPNDPEFFEPGHRKNIILVKGKISV